MKLTTHLKLVLRLRKRGFIHPFPHMPSWCIGATLPLYLYMTHARHSLHAQHIHTYIHTHTHTYPVFAKFWVIIIVTNFLFNT
jgi:hypothetical protein